MVLKRGDIYFLSTVWFVHFCEWSQASARSRVICFVCRDTLLFLQDWYQNSQHTIVTQHLLSLHLMSKWQQTVSKWDYKDEESPVRKMTWLQNNLSKICLHHFKRGSCQMPGAHFESRHLSRSFHSETANGANTARVSELPLPLSGDSDDNPSTPIDYLHHHPVETQRASHYPRVNTSEPNVNSAWANKQEKTRHLRAVKPRLKDWWLKFQPLLKEEWSTWTSAPIDSPTPIRWQNKWQFLPKIPVLTDTRSCATQAIAHNQHS